MAQSAMIMRNSAAASHSGAGFQPHNLAPEAERSDFQQAQWLSFLGGTRIQTKLEVSQPGDAHEREADAMADRVIGMGTSAIPISSGAAQISRKCSACEEEVKTVQRKAEEAAQVSDAAQPAAEAVVQSGGNALDTNTHAFMTSRFGTDFSDVRIHTGEEAARSAKALGAKAFTVGSDIVFGAGQYDPQGAAGQHLLAHELTHVIQQRGGALSIQREVDEEGDESGAETGEEEDLFAVADSIEDPELGRADEAIPEGPNVEDPFEATGGKKKKGGGGKNKEGDKGKKKDSGGNVCSSGDCPQGKQVKMHNNDCAESDAVNKDKFIKQLDVKISAHEVTATWSDGTTNTWPCSANPTVTPKTKTEVVGLKCSKEHTNAKVDKNGKVDGMAWFTGFQSEGKRIGFHDSQPVGTGFKSHGCVRVCCDVAQTINKNTTSGVTKITVVA